MGVHIFIYVSQADKVSSLSDNVDDPVDAQGETDPNEKAMDNKEKEKDQCRDADREDATFDDNSEEFKDEQLVGIKSDGYACSK